MLLATACLTVGDSQGQLFVCRAMIDQCSEASFISESLVHTARLRRTRSKVVVTGVGDPEGTRVKGRVSLRVFSRLEQGESLDLDALILSRITSYVSPNVDLKSYSE